MDKGRLWEEIDRYVTMCGGTPRAATDDQHRVAVEAIGRVLTKGLREAVTREREAILDIVGELHPARTGVVHDIVKRIEARRHG